MVMCVGELWNWEMGDGRCEMGHWECENCEMGRYWTLGCGEMMRLDDLGDCEIWRSYVDEMGELVNVNMDMVS